jgi:nucleotidyltransferase substrate binding protein (TIGR01987 family)
MENKDVRWIQRFSNYRKALARLSNAIQISEERTLNELEEQGLIQAFEFTFELAWNTLQDFLRDNGYPDIKGGPTVIIEKALAEGYIKNEQAWKELQKSRNLASHAYDEEMAKEIVEKTKTNYYGLFLQLETRLQLEKINQEKNG